MFTKNSGKQEHLTFTDAETDMVINKLMSGEEHENAILLHNEQFSVTRHTVQHSKYSEQWQPQFMFLVELEHSRSLCST